MLVTPLPGTHPENLLNAMRSVHQHARSLYEGGPDDTYQRLIAYLNWSSNAVRMLRGQLRGADLDRLVLTRRHAALLDGVGHLAGSDQASLVLGLVRLELEERLEDFEQAIRDYEHVTQRWRAPLRLLVPDSSLFVKHPTQLEETDIAALIGGGPEPVHVLVPMMVVDELDRLKESKDRHVRWRAGYSLAVIDRLLRKSPRPVLFPADSREDPDAPPRGEVTVEVLLDPPAHARLPNADDEIVDRAVVAQSVSSTPVTLVTYDTGQATRGHHAGLRVRHLRDDAGTGPEPEKK
ncbi:PIN domain-containing protein [Streptomyces sp. NPDC088736]|uniref:PIN domain-containing protein n=1 Tax=Streptomyces sp. NPDC088736 TaxID=3365881 RepID=UPI0037F7385E